MQTLKEEIRNKIIEAAVSEIAQNGYEKASMRTIAKAAGISVSNTYNYYRSKEELFESIIEPVYDEVKNIFRQSLQQSLKKVAGGNTLQPFIDGIVNSFVQMDDRQRRLLIILAEKSAGTKYENSREEMVGLLKMHLAEAVRQPGSAGQIDESQGYILNIIAANYIDGLLKVLNDYRSREWAEANLRTLLTYHLNGIKAIAG
jgi:AcrR family transcriptional regulator